MKKNLYIEVFTVVLIIFMTISLCIVPSAFAGDDVVSSKLIPTMKVVPRATVLGDKDIIYTFGGMVQDKKAAIEVLNSFVRSTNTIVTNGYSYNFSAFKSIPFGNGECNAYFSSNLDFNLPQGFTTSVTVVQASSNVTWTGTSPQYNANTLIHSDIFKWNGIGSVSISTSGGGWSIVSNTASCSYMSYNTWYSNHTFGGLTGSQALTSIEETTTGDFRFESVHTSITPTAYKSMWL
ncbi:hypothetical protein [Caldisericum exile]|uniref:hypothetical protein n=1 Tax=Caldisericum exile TaxID=693075 RepID=UPI003C73B48A